jgi:DNA-binding MarR family transcriptional regulator
MVHPTSVTNTIQRLEQAGYVRREPNPRDGRGTLARITDSGRAVVQVVTKDLMAAEFGLAALDTPQREALTALLREVRVAAGDFGRVDN